jgi:hypothetical protein
MRRGRDLADWGLKRVISGAQEGGSPLAYSPPEEGGQVSKICGGVTPSIDWNESPEDRELDA